MTSQTLFIECVVCQEDDELSNVIDIQPKGLKIVLEQFVSMALQNNLDQWQLKVRIWQDENLRFMELDYNWKNGNWSTEWGQVMAFVKAAKVKTAA